MFTGKKFWMRTESVLNELWEILWMIWSSVSQSLKLGWIYSHHRAFDYKALPVCVCACAHACMCVKSCLTFCNPIDYSLLGSLSMEFFRQGYWWGLAFPSSGDLRNPGIKPISLVSLALACGLFTSWTTGEAPIHCLPALFAYTHWTWLVEWKLCLWDVWVTLSDFTIPQTLIVMVLSCRCFSFHFCDGRLIVNIDVWSRYSLLTLLPCLLMYYFMCWIDILSLITVPSAPQTICGEEQVGFCCWHSMVQYIY